jgi:hypothetical protein
MHWLISDRPSICSFGPKNVEFTADAHVEYVEKEEAVWRCMTIFKYDSSCVCFAIGLFETLHPSESGGRAYQSAPGHSPKLIKLT